MACHSPIVVDSSPQASFDSPSITPQTHRRKSSVAFSSSPGLTELPTFAKVPARGLKSGSNAQQVPQGAALGFAAAGTLLKNDQAKAQAKERDHGYLSEVVTDTNEKYSAASEKGSGKPSKPKKTEKPGQSVKRKTSEPKRPLLKGAEEGRSNALETGDACPYFGRAKLRTPSISLSEYDFRREEHQGLPTGTSAPPKSEKKQRQRKVKAVESSKKDIAKKARSKDADFAANPTDVAGRKPKRPFPKSASIVLNSDDSNSDAIPIVEYPGNETVADGSRNVGKHLKDEEQSVLLKIPFQVEKVAGFGCIGAATADKCTYFAKEPRRNPAESQLSVQRSESRPPDEPVAALPTLIAAPRRRLSWTPVKNTVGSRTTPDRRPGTSSSTESEARTKSLASLISGFEYTDRMSNPVSHDRTAVGETLTKRRRMELAGASTIAPTKRKAAPSVPSEPTKKIKKKPQTITALATKAYHHETEAVPAQPSVSEFFDVEPSANIPRDSDATPLSEHGMVKKSRKPRVKNPDNGAIPSHTKKSRKPKKVKVKFNDKDYLANLYTPDEARAQEHDQDFMFGTSSQLALEESPSFIRDIQAAIFESESMPIVHTRDNTRSNSHAHVSNDVTGTRISTIQTGSDFWSSAARDEHGQCLELDTNWEKHRLVAPVCKPDKPAHLTAIVIDETHLANTLEACDQEDDEASNLLDLDNRLFDRETQANLRNTATDLGQTSPGGPFRDSIGTIGIVASKTPVAASSPAQLHLDNEWAVMSSDDSPAYVAQGPAFTPLHSRIPAPYNKPAQLVRSAISPVIARTALQNLDANAGLLSHTSALKNVDLPQQRSMTSTASDQARRPRGRPRKTAAAPPAVVSSPKRRAPSNSSKLDASASIPSAAASGEGPTLSASQPTESSSWTNIDEISDSDSPSTPSPPRQRAGSSPAALQPLDLAVVASPSLIAKAPALVSSTLKSTDFNFAGIQADLFPRISATIRSTAPSTDMKNPTWHEKILLYDPIVLEDLTAWLNEQGLGIEMQRVKPKPKTKGRKKKDAPPEEQEYEIVKEELKPWMVQKWCEEKSICCLWKEGLRGGVRTRY